MTDFKKSFDGIFRAFLSIKVKKKDKRGDDVVCHVNIIFGTFVEQKIDEKIFLEYLKNEKKQCRKGEEVCKF